MKLQIFVVCLVMTVNGIVNGHSNVGKLINVDEILVLKGVSNQLNELSSGLEQYDQSYMESTEFTETPNDSSVFDIRFDKLPEKCVLSMVNHPPKSCAEATVCIKRSGIYKILFEKYSHEPFLVECDVKTAGGDWTLIQRRQEGSVDFFRDWNEYKKGFGDVAGEFFIGLDKLHYLTNFNGPQELLIILEDKNEIRYAKYSNFVIGNENESYVLKHLGFFSGDAGDSLAHHLGAKFSTKDRDNDPYEGNCAIQYTGAWWYKACHLSNLNGKHGDNAFGKGINWFTYRGHNSSIEHVTMMIRRRRF